MKATVQIRKGRRLTEHSEEWEGDERPTPGEKLIIDGVEMNVEVVRHDGTIYVKDPRV